MSREELIANLEASFGDLQASIGGLSSQEMLDEWYDGWTVRDILGHIIGWHEATADIFGRMARGERPVPDGIDYSDSDAWNARFAQLWRARSPQEAVAELAATKTRVVEAANLVPEERFTEGRTAYRVIIGNGAHHYDEHSSAIREWRKSKGY